jgi:hypothetical protein
LFRPDWLFTKPAGRTTPLVVSAVPSPMSAVLALLVSRLSSKYRPVLAQPARASTAMAARTRRRTVTTAVRPKGVDLDPAQHPGASMPSRHAGGATQRGRRAQPK